jgi:hypothetical protein
MVLVGNLKDLRLANIIQLNCMERNVAKVTVSSHEGTGFLYFAEGQIVHAEFSPYIGERAVYEMLSLNDGQFKVEAGVQSPAHTIKKPWNSVVLDCLRELDEKNQKTTSVPKQAFSLLSNQKIIKQIVVTDLSGKLIEGKNTEQLNGVLISFTWYKLKKILTLFYNENFQYTFLRGNSGYLFIIEFRGTLVAFITDINVVPQEITRLITKVLKGIE